MSTKWFRGRLRVRLTAAILAVTVAAQMVVAPPASAAVFSNSASITIHDPNDGSFCTTPPGTSTPYPSNISVSGLTGTVSKVTVTLNNVSSTFAPDVDVLLVGPTGTALMLVSDAGGTNPGTLTNVTVTLDDDAPGQLPSSPPSASWAAPNSSVTSKPVDYDVGADLDTLPSPAPASFGSPAPGGVATLANTFNGINPNGTWSLYAVDDGCAVGDTNRIAGGWSLNITTAAAAAATTTSVGSSPNPSATGQSVLFTATVTSGGSPVTTGSVTFTEGGTTLAADVALNGAGQASFSTSSLAEGAHTITATYGGTASFATSNGSVNQRVDNATTSPSAGTFCNTGVITIPSNLATTPGVPYPSHITVSGFSGTVGAVTAQLKNVSHPHSEDIDVLLVGPNSANDLVLASDAPSGATAAVDNVTVTFDDAAAAQLPTNSAWGSANSSVTAKPTDFDPLGASDTFPSPAPAPSSNTTLASAFAGIDPNGQWSLYVVDDGIADSGSIAGGWCLTLTPRPTVTIDDVSLNEGNSGTTSFTFTVSLSAPAGPGGVTFDVATADGTAQDDNPATEDDDYTAKSLTGQTIPAGSSTYTFGVLVNGDTTLEPNETFSVNVTNVTGATVTDGQGQGTIANDDRNVAPTTCDAVRPGPGVISGSGALSGGPGNDTILGSTGSDTIDGAGGDDLLCGVGGNDRITGGSGNDTIDGGAGSDEILGGPGNDTIDGGSGSDRLLGEGGDDTLRGGGGSDQLVGGDGKDRIDGGSESDACDGGPDADLINGCEMVVNP